MDDLTATEVQNLMTSYMTNTMAFVVTADLMKKVEDAGVKKMLKFGLKIATEEVEGAEFFLKKSNRALQNPSQKRIY
ncbi:DUF3231 family protein [Litchfieldia salsa]|uniref:Uncharacterized protein n=1 Tax=Litchfieldia salsa TaxID=930152 RepID=A0A1H0TZR7_9BACI|nr:DUF3231 family protein [Litchfieldia salsa]SDP59401.1 Protein of unknown function [Litchfieldia salsa]